PPQGEAVRGWSPATFRGDERKLANVETVCALGLDGDHTELTVDQAAATFASYLGLIHTTKRHTPSEPRFRLVILLSRSVTVAEYSQLVAWVEGECGIKFDDAAKDASRFWYAPVWRDGYDVRLLGGAPLDVDVVLAEAPNPGRTPARLPAQTTSTITS